MKDRVVSIDAMGCWTDVAETIVAADGWYLLAVTDGEATLHARANAKSVLGQCGDEDPGPGSDLPVTDNARHRSDSPAPRDFAFALGHWRPFQASKPTT